MFHEGSGEAAHVKSRNQPFVWTLTELKVLNSSIKQSEKTPHDFQEETDNVSCQKSFSILAMYPGAEDNKFANEEI